MVKNIVRGIVGRHRGHAHRAMQFAMLPKVTKPNLRGKKKKKILKLDERLLSPATSQGDKSEDEKKGAEESQPASVEASQDLLAMQVVQQKVSAPVSGAENVLALNDSWSFRQQSNISSSTAEVTKQQAEVKAPSGRAFGETLGAANEGQSELAVSPDSASSAESGNSEADDDDADAVSASSACKAAFPTDEAAKSEPVTFQFNLTSLAPADANPAPVGFGFGPAVAEPTLTDFKFFAVPTTPAPVQAAATPAAGQMARAVLSPSLIDPRCVMPRGTPRQGEKGGEAGEEEAAAGEREPARTLFDGPQETEQQQQQQPRREGSAADAPPSPQDGPDALVLLDVMRAMQILGGEECTTPSTATSPVPSAGQAGAAELERNLAITNKLLAQKDRQLAKLQSRFKSVEQQLQQETEKSADSERRRKETEITLSSTRAGLNRGQRAKVDEVTRAVEHMKSVESDLEHEKSSNAQLHQDNDELKRRVAELQAAASAPAAVGDAGSEQDVRLLKAENASLRVYQDKYNEKLKECFSVRQDLAAALAETGKIQKELAERGFEVLKAELAFAQRELQESQNETTSARNERDAAERRCQEATAQQRSAREAFQKLEARWKEESLQVANLERTVVDLRSDLSRHQPAADSVASSEMLALKRKLNDATNLADSRDRAVADHKKTVVSLEQELKSLRAAYSEDRAKADKRNLEHNDEVYKLARALKVAKEQHSADAYALRAQLDSKELRVFTAKQEADRIFSKMASILRALEGVVQRPKDELAKEVARAQAEVQQLSEAAKARFSELEHKEKPSTTPPRLFPDANGAAPPAREPSLPRADSAQQSAVAASLQSDVAKLQKQLGTAESEAEASKRAAIERARQADEATAALKHATEQVAAKEKKLAAAEAEAKRLEKLKTDAEAKASNLQADLEHLRSSAAEDAQPTTGPEAQRLENLRHQAEARSTALQNDVRALREKLASSERSAAASTAKAEAAAAEADRLSYQSKQSEARSAALEAEVRELRGKLASAAASNLKAEAAMAEEATTQNDVRELREKLASSERSAAASTAKAEAAAAEADRLSNQSKQSEVRSAALEAEVRELRGKLASLAASTAKAEAAAEETEETLLENLRDQAKARPSTLKSEIHEQLRAKASAADGTAAATLLLSQPPPAAGGDLADATGVKQEANGLCPAAACPPRCGSPEARSPPGLRRELEATVDRLSVKLSATAAALAESNARRAEAEDAVASLRAAERSPPQRSPAQPASPDLVGGAQVRVSALEARVGALQHTVDRLTNEKEQLSLAVVTVSDTAMSRVAVAEKKAGELQSKLEKVNAELVTRKAHEAAVRSYSTAREDRGSLTREAPSLSRGGEFRALYESEKHKSRALSRRLESISREIDRTRTECAVSPELVPLSQFDSNLPHDLPLSQPQSSQYPTSGYPGSFAPPGYCYASELPNHLPSPSPGTPSSLVPVVLTYNTMLTPQSGGAHPMWFPGRLSAPQVPNPSQHEVEDSTGDVEHGENVTLSQNLYLSQNLNQSQNPNQSQNQQEMHQVKLEHNAPPTPPSSRADTADNSQPKTAGKRPPAPVSSSQRAKRQRTMSQVEVSDTDSERQEIRRPRLSQQEAKKLTDRQIHSRIRALRPDTWTGTEDRKLADLCKKELPKCVGAEKTARLNKLFDKAAKVLEKDRDVVENHFWANKESLSQEMNTPVPKRPTRSYTDEQQEVWDDLSELVQAADDKHKARELASHVMAEITGKSAASIRPAMR